VLKDRAWASRGRGGGGFIIAGEDVALDVSGGVLVPSAGAEMPENIHQNWLVRDRRTRGIAAFTICKN